MLTVFGDPVFKSQSLYVIISDRAKAERKMLILLFSYCVFWAGENFSVLLSIFQVNKSSSSCMRNDSLRCRRTLSIDWVLRASAQIHRISCSIKHVKYAHKKLLCKLFSLITHILASHISCRVRYVIF